MSNEAKSPVVNLADLDLVSGGKGEQIKAQGTHRFADKDYQGKLPTQESSWRLRG